ncbi:MAG: hypothetical protein HYZ72_16625 [Deltaproteobacteria bacterium]|nr:hypothetical protein [Deltaproteobacteria bacterium]
MISTWVPFALSLLVLSAVEGSKGERRFLPLLLALLLFPPHFSFTFAQVGGGMPRISPPPLVRMTCALAPLDDTQRSSLTTLVVHIKENKWRLRIREIKALTATTNSGWGLLKDLFPPRLRFIGPDDLIARLQQDNIAGLPLILEGRLYVGDHLLYLTAVTVTEP